ncbi:chemerin-like receptor 1 isoform X3 [Rhineura floridana]|uniref:chemerin-like receptor 1 isoform X3 n=1 Tax=Rhineura floridana TaxID=261503 RepID=UPI002AC85978|nr:chemerin-like receptor 1 isoform X3 [Rhineura floridana]
MEYTTVPPYFTVSQINSNGSIFNTSPGSGQKYDEEAYALYKRINFVTMVIYSLSFLLGVTGNGLVIFIAGFRMKKTVNTVWFLNLAITDFTFTFFQPLTVAYIALDFHWPFGLAMCKLISTLAFFNLYASVYLLMVISVDRCISVWCPVWSRNHRTPRLASFVALGVWIMALVLCSPYFHFRDTAPSPNNKNQINCFNNYGKTKEEVNLNRQAIIISRFIFAFAIPFSAILFCYGAIVLKLKRDQLAQSSKPFKVITAVIVAFFICWFPYHVFSFLETKLAVQPELLLVLRIGYPLASSLAFINSCLNPILYVFMGHDFKEKLKLSLLSAFENAFSEDSSQSTTSTKSSTELDIRP